MPKVVVTAQVEDSAAWERVYRTHGDLFRRATVANPINIAINDGNEVAVCYEPENLDKLMEMVDSPEAAEAMSRGGVKRDTVKVYVFDKEVAF